jgi:CheY-like chemotaxis protein
MPELSGIELLRRLRELKLPVLVIVITAHGRNEDRRPPPTASRKINSGGAEGRVQGITRRVG